MKEVKLVNNHEIAASSVHTTGVVERVSALQVSHAPTHNQVVALHFLTDRGAQFHEPLCLVLSVPAAHELRRQLGVAIREYLHSESPETE